MDHSIETGIPSVELTHNNKKVDFAFRTMEDIHTRIGNTPDLPHRHNYYTVLWSSNACGLHYIDYKEHTIRPNCIFFVNPGQVHQVITYGKPEGMVIMFTPEFLQQNLISEEFITNLGLFSDSADTPPLQINEQAGISLKDITSKLKDSFNGTNSFKMDMLGAYLKLFLIECNVHAPIPDDNHPQTLQSGRVILKAFKTLIEENFTEWHKVSNYAGKLNISPDYLNNVVKTSIGKTAKEFIQNRLVLEAKRMGVHTYLSNKEIAYELGFDDPSHFSKFFKNNEGESFSDFRKSLEKNTFAKSL